jgi:glycosyltransferase involved in cell wall biosynthesis
MRVLFVTNYYPPYEVGGYEQLCRDVANRLAARGHAIAILTSEHGVGRRTVAGEACIYRVLRLSPDWDSSLNPALQFFLTRRAAQAHNARRLRSQAAQFRPDVIFMWNLDCLPPSIAADAEAIRNVGVAYWLAGPSPAAPDAYARYWAQQPSVNHGLGSAKSLLRRLALSVSQGERKRQQLKLQHAGVVSDYLRREGIRDGTLPGQARVIYNGVELDQFDRPVPAASHGDLVLLQAGRVSADKGVHTSIEAVASLARKGVRNVHLCIAGSGPADYGALLQQMVDRGGVTGMISFLGKLPRSAMPELLARCQVLLLPTIGQEPFARVVLEAMAAGLAVSASQTGGTDELLRPEDTGLVFAAGDSQDLARQIQRLVTNPALRIRLASKGQRIVRERFGMDQMVAKVETLLNEAWAARATS